MGLSCSPVHSCACLSLLVRILTQVVLQFSSIAL